MHARQKEVEQGGLRGQPYAGKMGLAFTKLFARLFSKKEMRILMVSPGARFDAQVSSAWQTAGHLSAGEVSYCCPSHA